MPQLPWPHGGFIPLLAISLLVPALDARAQNIELGKQVFTADAAPQCMLCHTLAAAGATGEVGPNLDELKPTEERVRLAVQRGVGNMPPFGETLSEEQIAAVARFVAEAVK